MKWFDRRAMSAISGDKWDFIGIPEESLGDLPCIIKANTAGESRSYNYEPSVYAEWSEEVLRRLVAEGKWIPLATPPPGFERVRVGLIEIRRGT